LPTTKVRIFCFLLLKSYHLNHRRIFLFSRTFFVEIILCLWWCTYCCWKTILNHHLTFSQIYLLCDQFEIWSWFHSRYESVYPQEVDKLFLKEWNELFNSLFRLSRFVINQPIFYYGFYLRFLFDCRTKVNQIAENFKTFACEVRFN